MIREVATSKAIWRAVIALILTLLLLLLFRAHVGTYLEQYRDQGSWRSLESANSSALSNDIDWSEYAYGQYATTTEYLCNSLMIFESLERLGSKASRLMLYPRAWSPTEGTSEGRMLLKARHDFHVVLQPVEVQHFGDDLTWADSFTKLLAFNQTAYKRVLSLDSDSTVLQPMDELFLMPPAPVAMPRAYWLSDKPTLSSQLVLIQPSEFEMRRVLEAVQNRTEDEFDMEIVNNLYGKHCIIIPHRRYALLSGEFRKTDHHPYLGSKEEAWDPDAAYKEAKLMHFSDWPLPKPWVWTSREGKDEVAPACHARGDGTQDCRDRDMWFFVYKEFLERRERVCGSEFLPSLYKHPKRRSKEPVWLEPRSGTV